VGYSQDDQIKEDEMGGHAGRMEETKNTHEILIRKFESKRSLGRSAYRWEVSIKMALKETEWKFVGLG
jgi:hypothetical protein